MGTGNPFMRTLIVSPGADPGASGTNLLDTITTVIGKNPSATSPWLIHIEPGTYDVQASTVVMQQFVDIEGSGQNSTLITGKGSKTSAVVVGADGTELRDLSVRCDAAGTVDGECFTIANGPTVSMMITNVTASSVNTTALGVVLLIQGGGTTVTNTTLVALGGEANGVVIGDGFPTFTNLVVFGKGGASAGGAGVTGINIFNNAAPTFTDSTVTVLASPSPSPATGIFYAYGNPSPAPVNNGLPKIEGSTIQAASATAGQGVALEMAAHVLPRAILIRNSVLSGNVSVQGDNSPAQIAAATANTELDGALSLGPGALLVCTGDYNRGFTALADGATFLGDTSGACQ
jgi:hypothetical protein